ncbi:MAG: glycerate kinase, partial [Actinomycetales bacterium]|nr:glycerate kinase [Actinomycetales bacterium]
DVVLLDSALARLVDVLASDCASAPGAGAAGGTAFGLAAVLGARIVPGAAHLADLAGIDGALDGADLALTGEGSFDAQSLGGKLVGEVLARARRAGVAVAVVAGRAPEPQLVPGVPTASLTERAGSTERALAEPARWAAEAAALLARAWGELAWGPPSDPSRPTHVTP